LATLCKLQRREGSADALIEALDSAVLTEFHRDEVALLQSQAELAVTLYDTHPEVQSVAVKLQELRQKIDSEVERLVPQLETESKIAGARVRSLQQRLEKMQIARREAREPEVPLRGPQGEAYADTQLSDSPPQRGREMREQPEISPGVRLFSVADVRHRPSSPNPILFVFPGLVVFSIAGGSWLPFWERWTAVCAASAISTTHWGSRASALSRSYADGRIYG
jgi:uncharacterized protein involved in exopolysaccharide biosynthesis